MLEESSIWATMNSWFTPTILFLLMNLMVGVVAVASGFGTHKPQQQQEEEDEKLVRSPSRLERLRSMNFYIFRSEDYYPLNSITTTIKPEPTTTIKPEPTTTTTTHHVTQHSTDSNDNETHDEDRSSEANDVVPERDLDEIYRDHVQRTTSDTKPASGFMPTKLPKKMKKSASVKSSFSHFQVEDIVEPPKRPSTVKEGKTTSNGLQSFGDDEEVDAKADDFINRFKQQQRLQRVDSMLRYKETINRG